MDWRGRAAATGARAKRQGSRQAACAAQSVVLGRLSVKRISRSWAKREAEREKGQTRASKQEVGCGKGTRGHRISRERGVEGLAGEGFGCACACMCVFWGGSGVACVRLCMC